MIRLYLTSAKIKEFKPLTEYCVKNKLAYHVVTNEELDTITSSTHHEGVCALFKRPKILSLNEYLKNKKDKDLILSIVGVKNPHNIGPIMRICAHFGVNTIFFDSNSPVFSASAYRTSEGGAEALSFVQIQDLGEALMQAKKAQYQILTTSSHPPSINLYQAQIKNKAIIVMGEEREGLSAEILKLGDLSLMIPGSGAVESLNVSSAVSVILSHLYSRLFQ